MGEIAPKASLNAELNGDDISRTASTHRFQIDKVSSPPKVSPAGGDISECLSEAEDTVPSLSAPK